MAFDQKTRNLLQRTITACRRVFDREFTAQLQELYGIQPDGTLTQCEMLDHLADEELEVARLLRSRLNHLEGGEPYEAFTRTQAKPENVARVIREQAFTVLNRLAALRLCEERGLVLECVRQGVNSEGFQLFMTTAGNALGETHEAYLVYLYRLFDELALDLGVLFDRFSPLALLFPRKDALEEVLRELNGTGKAAENEAISAEQFAEMWKADETIGWIYQYYNDEAERKKMREESSAPRNSRELAVRNQFFTPRYVVEFLTDNTLGRLWYEMRHGKTVLRDRCAFLVRRPTEIFLKPGGAAPESSAGNEPSQEELLRQPVYIPHRALKDPREIRLLDPACGSMHFGLYAFDLLTVIYDEAWEIAHGPDEVAKSTETFAPFVAFAVNYSDKAAYLLQVPRLIIEHNIHGIDIDPRAAQIAGLSLWLRAQRAWHEAGIKPADRPRITRSNIVCAEPMPGEKKLLREFVEQQFEINERPAFAFLLEKIFDHMALAGEAGSLLRIEEEIRSAIAEASVLSRSHPVPRQAPLFPGVEKPDPLQLELQGLVAEHFWREAEQRIYDALESYAERTENDNGFQRRLFANDAAQGFAFIDLCRKRYDVAVMNPPFGEFSKVWKDQAKKCYPRSSNDILAAFVERGISTLEPSGFVGAITSRTCFFLLSFQAWREQVILKSALPTTIADLGHGVMDSAMVEAAAYVLASSTAGGPVACLRLLNELDKQEPLIQSIRAIRENRPRKGLFLVEPREFQKVPGSPFCYWVESYIRDLFVNLPPFDDGGREAKQGLATGDDFRFARTWWEVEPSAVVTLTAGSRQDDYKTATKDQVSWSSFAKGGAFSPFYQDLTLVVRWTDDGNEIRNFTDPKTGSELSRYRGAEKYFEPGFTYADRASSRFCPRVLPEGAIISVKGSGIYCGSGDVAWSALAILNSLIFTRLMDLLLGRVELAKSYQVNTVGRVPWPTMTPIMMDELGSAARDGWNLTFSFDRSDLSSHAFVSPSLALGTDSIARRQSEWLRNLTESRFRLGEIQSRIDRTALLGYGLSEGDFAAMELALAQEPSMAVSDDGASHGLQGDGLLVESLLDYTVGCVFGRWDIRYATGEQPAPELPDPFAPLPVCSPGMLQADNGLPVSPEAGRHLRAEEGYPLDVAWEGILVDDSEHPLDVERRIHTAIAVIWGDEAEDLEREACEMIGAPTLREWFRRPAGFFADHLKRHSKSRRQAPIYWPLSTSSGRYTLWLYYHRLTPDTLYKCLQQFVVPKLADAEKELARLRTVLAANEGGVMERNRLAELEDLRRELIELRVELELWAPKWKPNLNDGVLINAAPLWKLFRLPKWQKDLKACWQELEKGDYDWAHLAYTLWPDRVREKCKADRSLAIAHGLEEICEVKVPAKKVKKTKKTATRDDLQEFFEG
jgi:hypothetical protein